MLPANLSGTEIIHANMHQSSGVAATGGSRPPIDQLLINGPHPYSYEVKVTHEQEKSSQQLLKASWVDNIIPGIIVPVLVLWMSFMQPSRATFRLQ